MIFTKETTRLCLTLASGALLAACESTPAIQGSSPDEIGQSLGYARVISVENVPDPATFTLEPVNSSTAIMGGRFGVRYLISFAHNCPEAGFGNRARCRRECSSTTNGRWSPHSGISNYN